MDDAEKEQDDCENITQLTVYAKKKTINLVAVHATDICACRLSLSRPLPNICAVHVGEGCL